MFTVVVVKGITAFPTEFLFWNACMKEGKEDLRDLLQRSQS